MTVTVGLTGSQIGTVLRGFLLTILPSAVEVVEGQVNRVVEPASPDFVVITETRRVRLATNIDMYDDARFIASIVGTLLNITGVDFGAIGPGSTVFGTGVVAGTTVLSTVSGTGGVGTYNLSQAGNQPPGSIVAAGTVSAEQRTEVVIQCDVHGPAAADNAQAITTLFRDKYALAYFADSGFDVHPLYADDPKQIPFIDAEKQYEDRWVVEAHLQANIPITIPQQFADAVTVGLINVDASYPP